MLYADLILPVFLGEKQANANGICKFGCHFLSVQLLVLLWVSPVPIGI